MLYGTVANPDPVIRCRRTVQCHIWRGADKSLAWPGRKQATATKLGIYATYSPRSSIHFLTHYSNFCKPLKKNSEGCLSDQVCGNNDLSVGRKMATFQLCLQSRQQIVVRQGRVRRIGRAIKTLEAQVGQFLLVASARWAGTLSCKNKTPLVKFPRRFSFKMSFCCTSWDE